MEGKNNIALLVTAVNFVFGLILLTFCYATMGNLIKDWWNMPKADMEVAKLKRTKKTKLPNKIVNGIHLETGLVYAEGFEIVRGTCTACHSAKLVTQNRATREGWKQMITWMQQTQGLWDLGKNEAIILNYLAEHYAPKASGRRANIDTKAIEWYVLNLEEE